MRVSLPGVRPQRELANAVLEVFTVFAMFVVFAADTGAGSLYVDASNEHHTSLHIAISSTGRMGFGGGSY